MLQLLREREVHPSAGLRCCLLGGFRILSGEKLLTAEQIHLRKARDLIKLLALAPNHRLHREQLLEMLWFENAPQAAAHNLSQTLYKLRPKLRELDPSARLEFEDECLVLRVDGGFSTDVEDFEQAARPALSYMGPINSQVAACCQEAIVAYTGDLLPEDGPSDLFYQRRDQLRQLYIELLLLLADYSLEAAEYLPAIDAVQKAIASDPANEEAHFRLMRAYALDGQRQAALRQYQTLEEELRRELDVDPTPKSQRLREQILSGELAPSRLSNDRLAQPRHNLPALVSSFIGREVEVEKVRGLTRGNRLVTLTGAGGVGKTRLALRAAEGQLDEFPQGVYWVELASLSNPSLVAKTVLDVFRLPEQYKHSEMDRLVDFLRDRNLLLLFDNCEHLITSCASLAETLLKACPNLHILVTSRVRLNLPGEITYHVPSLAAPDPTSPISLTELVEYDAVRLFTERSGRDSQSFTLSTANASAVALICQRLDGIPLAIELAAARSRMMTAEQIAVQLKDAFHLLVGGSQTALPRHRTLRASIEWSYNLLPMKARLLLNRLSVFSKGLGLEAAEVVCAGEEIRQVEVLDLLECLVDNSLVIVDTCTADEARYHLLETVRQYAYERLVGSSELTSLSQRLMTYFLQLAEQANVEIRGPKQLVWIKRLEKERSNLTSVLERAFNSPSSVELGIQLACALDWYWTLTGDFVLLRYFLGKVLAASADFGRTPTRARALFHAGSSFAWGGHSLGLHEAKDCLEESLDIWRELGQDYIQEEAQCLLALGFLKTEKFYDEQGLDLMIESMVMFQKINNSWWRAWALNLISMSREEKHGDARAVRAILQEDAIIWRKAGDRWGEAFPLSAWGLFALTHGDFVEAQAYLRRSLEIFQEFGSKAMAAKMLRDLGHASIALQEYDQAEMYFENYEVFAQEMGWDTSFTHCALGFVALHKGDNLHAEKYFNDALKIAQDSGLKDRIVFCIAGFASLCAVREKPVAAASLFGAFITQVDANQIQVAPVNQIEIDHFLELCKAQIQKTAYDQAWHAGCAMTLEQAVLRAQESLG